MALAIEKENVMTGRRTMMVLATALLAGSLLATGAQAHGGGGGGGGGGGHGGGGGFSAGSMGGFGGGHGGGTWLASAGVARRAWAEITMAMEDVVSAAITTTAAVRIIRMTRHTTSPARTER